MRKNKNKVFLQAPESFLVSSERVFSAPSMRRKGIGFARKKNRVSGGGGKGRTLNGCARCGFRLGRQGDFFCNRQVCGGVFIGKFFAAGFQVMRRNETKVFLQAPESFSFHLNAFFPRRVCDAMALSSRVKKESRKRRGGMETTIKRLRAMHSIIIRQMPDGRSAKESACKLCGQKFFPRPCL